MHEKIKGLVLYAVIFVCHHAVPNMREPRDPATGGATYDSAMPTAPGNSRGLRH